MATQLVSSPSEPTRSDPPMSSATAETLDHSAPSRIPANDPAPALKSLRTSRTPVFSRGERSLNAEPSLDTEGLTSEPLKSDAAHHLEMGLFSFRKGMAYEAITQYQQALTQEPDNALAYYLLGITLKSLKQDDEARRAWTAAIETGEAGNEAQWARERAALLLSRMD